MMQEAFYKSRLEAQFSSALLSLEGTILEPNSHGYTQIQSGMLQRMYTYPTSSTPRGRFRHRTESNSIHRICQGIPPPALSPRRENGHQQDSICKSKVSIGKVRDSIDDLSLQVCSSPLGGDPYKLPPRARTVVQSEGIQQEKIEGINRSTKLFRPPIRRRKR